MRSWPRSTPGGGRRSFASYRELSRRLLAALESLGLHPDPPAQATLTSTDRDNPVCFEVPSAYEITVGGKKLIGSAQLRRRGAVLQHGSLPLEGDITRVVRVLRQVDESARRQAAERLGRHATTLSAVLGHAISWDSSAQAVQTGFSRALGWRFSVGELSSKEELRARQLEDNQKAGVSLGARVPG
jgi:lipoate-protein ligase A